jgi:hypothetical protein
MKIEAKMFQKGIILGFALLGLVTVNKNTAYAVVFAQKPEVIQQLHAQHKILAAVICVDQGIQMIPRSEISIYGATSLAFMDIWMDDLSRTLTKILRDPQNTQSISVALSSLGDLQKILRLQLNDKGIYLKLLQPLGDSLKDLVKTFDAYKDQYKDQLEALRIIVHLKCEDLQDLQKTKNFLKISHFQELFQEVRQLRDLENRTAEDFMRNWAHLLELAGNASLWIECESSNNPGLLLQIKRVVVLMGYKFSNLITLPSNKISYDFQNVGDDYWIAMLGQFKEVDGLHESFSLQLDDHNVIMLQALCTDLLKLFDEWEKINDSSLHHFDNVQQGGEQPMLVAQGKVRLQPVDKAAGSKASIDYLGESRWFSDSSSCEETDDEEQEVDGDRDMEDQGDDLAEMGGFAGDESISGRKRSLFAADPEHSSGEPRLRKKVDKEHPFNLLPYAKEQAYQQAGPSRTISKSGGGKISRQSVGIDKKTNSKPLTRYGKNKKRKDLALQELGQRLGKTKYDAVLDELKQQLLIFNQQTSDGWEKDILEYCDAMKAAEKPSNLKSFVKSRVNGEPEGIKYNTIRLNLRKIALKEIFKFIVADPKNFSDKTLDASIEKSRFCCSNFASLVYRLYFEFSEAIRLYQELTKAGDVVDVLSLCCEKTRLISKTEKKFDLMYLELILLSLYVLVKAPNAK